MATTLSSEPVERQWEAMGCGKDVSTGCQNRREGIEQVKEVLQILAGHARQGSTLALQALEQLRKDAPAYQVQLREACRLRAADEVAVVQPRTEMSHVMLELCKLPQPAAGALAILAMRAAAMAISLADLMVSQLFGGPSHFAQLALAAPGCILGLHYGRQLVNESGRDVSQWDGSHMLQNMQRLPPAFYAGAAVSGTVAIKAVSDIGAVMIRRFFRLKMLCSLATLYWLVKLQGIERVAKFLEVAKQRLPPQPQDIVDKVVHALRDGAASIGQKTKYRQS